MLEKRLDHFVFEVNPYVYGTTGGLGNSKIYLVSVEVNGEKYNYEWVADVPCDLDELSYLMKRAIEALKKYLSLTEVQK